MIPQKNDRVMILPKNKDLMFCILSAVMSYYLEINVHFVT